MLTNSARCFILILLWRVLRVIGFYFLAKYFLCFRRRTAPRAYVFGLFVRPSLRVSGTLLTLS